VRSSVAKLQQLQTQLGQTVVRAPVSGIVAEKIVNLGDVTNGTQKLFTLIGNGALELQAQVPATQLPQVRTGASAKITSDTDSRVSLSGTVREIAPLVNAQSRQALVRIDVPATTLLRPGMFARAAITTTTNTGVTVPNKAIQPQSDGSIMVFLLSGEDKVQARKVEVGEVVNGGNVEIKNGLKQGDRVVVAGAGYLKDGDRVRIASQ
jgi:RND family efflux transporter MFP subunit